MFQAERLHALRQPLRLERIGGGRRHSSLHRAKSAPSRADIAQNHEGGGPLRPALVNVGAMPLGANRVQFQVLDQSSDLVIGGSRLDPNFQPGGLGPCDTTLTRTTGWRLGVRVVGGKFGGRAHGWNPRKNKSVAVHVASRPETRDRSGGGFVPHAGGDLFSSHPRWQARTRGIAWRLALLGGAMPNPRRENRVDLQTVLRSGCSHAPAIARVGNAASQRA